jgi:hypothetical protein
MVCQFKALFPAKFCFFIYILFLMSVVPAYAGYHTNLQPGTAIQDSSGDIDTGAWSIPLVYDWNNDGNKDLIVGTANAGTAPVAYFENTGTNDSPAFDTYTWIQACNNTCTLLLDPPGG